MSSLPSTSKEVARIASNRWKKNNPIRNKQITDERKTSREQIYIAGQMNMLVRVGEIIKEANL